MNCKHCEFIEKISKYLMGCPDPSNREYWLITEVFVYLHDGKDYCDKEKDKKGVNMNSFRDENNVLWVACSECEKGLNGKEVYKCSCAKKKKFNGSGCFLGILMEKYTKDNK